jgi:hypothetical protein
MLNGIRRFGAVGLAGLALAGLGSGLFEQPKASAAVLAAASTTFGTGLQIINLGSGNATVTIQAYLVPSGNAPAGWPASGYTTDPIAPGGSKSFFSARDDKNDPLFKLIPDGSLVSFYLASDQPIAAGVNLLRVGNSNPENKVPGDSTNPFRVASSAGISDQAASRVVYGSQIPNYPSNGDSSFKSKVYIQNTASTDANVTITVFDKNGAVAKTLTNQVAKAFTAIEFDPTAFADIPTNQNLSIKADSNDDAKKLAMTVNFFNNASKAETSQFQSYNGSGTGSTKLYAPAVVGEYFGYNSGLAAQNIGTGPTNIRMTFNMAKTDGSQITFVQLYENVAPGQSASLYMGNAGAQLQDAGAKAILVGGKSGTGVDARGLNGSAVIESLAPTSGGGSAQPIIGNVNETKELSHPLQTSGVGLGDTYRMVRDDEALTKASFPQVVRLNTDNNLTQVSGGFTSGLKIQALGDNPSCTIAIANTAGTFNQTYTLAFNGRNSGPFLGAALPSQFTGNGTQLPNNFNGGATIDCGATRVVAIETRVVRNLNSASDVAGVGDSYSFTIAQPK